MIIRIAPYLVSQKRSQPALKYIFITMAHLLRAYAWKVIVKILAKRKYCATYFPEKSIRHERRGCGGTRELRLELCLLAFAKLQTFDLP